MSFLSARGAKIYDTGKPCKRGHTVRYVSSRNCVACTCERTRERFLANPEIVRDASRRYGAAHRERKNARHRRYYADNRERLSAQHKHYHAANRERILERKRQLRIEHNGNP